MIKDLGAGVVSVLEGFRPITKKMLEGVMHAGSTTQPTNSAQKFSYDAHADWELSRLLFALDEQSKSSSSRKKGDILNEIAQLAETCVRVLEAQSGSAEVFIQLAERAIKQHDYDKLDKLADRLAEGFSAGEIAEIVRQTEIPQIRAIAYETLALLPLSAILPMLDDPLYSEIAANALEQKAYEYDSEEARDLLDQFDSESEIRSE
jgi:predicted HTH domain antitoxin